uniref:Odorant receptor, family C, subfamily 102, member 1 n=1 Tax=Sinocyclocheilus grahami TaxID=75366 RepID=A0A672MI83_SINGR
SAILFLVYSLQRPVYYFIINLVVCDVLFSTATLPKIISRYWFQDETISFLGCCVQMFFVHYLCGVCSNVLVVMVMDRYAAICYPLQYHNTVSLLQILLACAVIWVICISWLSVVVYHAFDEPYCDSNVITQNYCDQNSIIKLSCGDVRQKKFFSFSCAMFVLLGPLIFIMFSFIAIITSVFKISDVQARYKTFPTCTPQLFIICLYYVPRCVVYVHDVTIAISPGIRVMLIMWYSLLPPVCFYTLQRTTVEA